MQVISVVDTHTAGEPTRVIVDGGPELGSGPLAARLSRFREQFDRFRSAVVNEPRGSDVMVGALLCPPSNPECAAGVIFFNNVGFLGMCGHGTIGVIAMLQHLGRIQPGVVRLETPVGEVSVTLHDDGLVSFVNVPSHRAAKDVAVELPDGRRYVGDVAWGGNWFYLVHSGNDVPLTLSHVDQLTDIAWTLRLAVNASGFPDVDHIELFGPPVDATANSRNFVLCPGKAYDRSPCGTGTSAKLACLAADGKLAPGEAWVQESILGTQFRGEFQWKDQAAHVITPTISGRAYVNAESRLLVSNADPFAWGIRTR